MQIILLGFLIRLSLAIIDVNFFALPGGEFDAFSFNRVAIEFSNHLESGGSLEDFNYIFGWVYSIFIGYVYYFFGQSNLLGSFLSCFTWLLSALVLRNVMYKLYYPKQIINFALIIYSFIFPTSIIFTSLMLREAYLLFFSNLLFLIIVNFYFSKNFNMKIFHLFFFILTSYLLSVFHKAGVLFVGSFLLFLILFITIKLKILKPDKLSIFIILFSIFIFEYYGLFEKIFNQIKSYQLGHFEQFENIRALYYSRLDIYLREYSLINLFSVFIENLYNYFFQPTIFKVSNYKDLPAVFENIIRIFALIIIIFKLFTKFENKSLFIILFMMHLLSEAVYAQASVNWGTASRHHIPALGYLILLIFFPKMKKSSIKISLKK